MQYNRSLDKNDELVNLDDMTALGSYMYLVSYQTWYCLLFEEKKKREQKGSILGYWMHLYLLSYPYFSCDCSCILMVITINIITDTPSYHHKDSKAHLWAYNRYGDQTFKWAESSTSCYRSHWRSLYLFGTSRNQ